MNFEKEIEDEVLGRWLNGELNGDDLIKFEASDTFQTYKMIADYSAKITAPEYDTNQSYKVLQEKIKAKKDIGKIIKMSWLQKLSIAAGIALLIGVGVSYFGNFSENTRVATLQGETKTILLPDNSEVELNIASTIEYNAENWENEREVDLQGEAYFKVSKGNRFAVNTNHGIIEVLGTEFNIRNRDNKTEVTCYEGTVKVTDQNKASILLNAGDAVRIVNGIIEDNWKPVISKDAEWKNGFSSFEETALTTVIQEIENQYEIKVKCNTDISNRTYVGAFPHDNIDKALELVFEPMQLKYTIKNDTFVIID